jgi:hypothetical protein
MPPWRERAMTTAREWASMRAEADRPARIVLERPGRGAGRSWRYVVSWRSGLDGIVLLREWGALGSERPRRRLRRCAGHGMRQRAIDGCVRRLLRRGYRVV